MALLDKKQLKSFLDKKTKEYNHPRFILNDPISIPKKFSKLQDIEIIGLWTALLSWGQRVSIINSGNRLIELMDGSPFDFVINHTEKDRARFLKFVHRTFQPIDALVFLDFFQKYYQLNESLEDAFYVDSNIDPIKKGLIQFKNIFFNSELIPKRTQKHIASPLKNSACKRLNMFLRWMVRDDEIVDFGKWKKINKKDLLVPLDVHVQRIALSLGLLKREKADWKALMELMENLRELDPKDPGKYDYALFGLGILQNDGLGEDKMFV
ncbi:MAG: TIGR02757 family protein [Saprospiraceae bacterium]